MRSIKHLPEAVHSSVRSGIIVCDLTRVVEELVFNSLDAGASKVTVVVGVTTCYIKVVDNGYGITRDGLMLLGERYATSKLDPTDGMYSASEGFGFRGEALSSISDASLLEIVTKSHGRANGYRKVMKGRKCLYLGIDDSRQDVGTTVTVRDLFYNQPVRRKHMQSSPKKVLHLIKTCVLRIALVHPEVLFKVVDIESEDELLCTYPSQSPVSLLTSCFGVEDSSKLYDLNVSDGALKLSGYISAPYDTYSVKAFQYIYINSRYICKGPLHKALNQLAMRFSSLDLWNAGNGSQIGKRSRSQTYATYILNLSCPQSSYALTFEPSKTSVEFKDWVPILDFVERAVSQLWSEKNGDYLSPGIDILTKDDTWKEDDIALSKEDFGARREVAKKRSRIQNHQPSFSPLSPQLAMQTEVSDQMFCCEDDDYSCVKSRGKALKFGEHKYGVGFVCEADYPCQSSDEPFAQCREQKTDSHMWEPDVSIFSSEDNILGSKFPETEIISLRGCEDDCLNNGDNMNDGVTRTALSCNSFKHDHIVHEVSRDLDKPFLQSCLMRSSTQPDVKLFMSDENLDSQTKGGRAIENLYNPDDHNRIDYGNKNLDLLPSSLWEDKTATMWPSPGHWIESHLHRGSDLLPRDSGNLFSVGGECFLEEDDFLPHSLKRIEEYGYRHQSLDSETTSLLSDPVSGVKVPEIEDFTHENVLGSLSKYDECAGYVHSAGREGKGKISNCGVSGINSGQENHSWSLCTNIWSDIKGHEGAEEDFGGFPYDDFLPKCSIPFTNKKGRSHIVSLSKNVAKDCAFPSLRDSPSFYLDEDLHEMDQYIQHEEKYVCKRGPVRSHSAPPFYRGRPKFDVLNICLNSGVGKPSSETFNDAYIGETSVLKHSQPSSIIAETSELKHSQPSSIILQPRPEPNFGKDPLFDRLDMTPDMIEIGEFKMRNKSQCFPTSKTMALEDFQPNEQIREDLKSREIQDSFDSGRKWRNNCPQITKEDSMENLHNEDSILDISSGLLHLAGESLVPKTISKNFLEDAKVLQQVDKKFIPVVSSGILGIIDQHAADERIRLEELRHKVLSGEMKTINYLEAEKEFVLPEIGYQLLHNYAEQIQNWGWICNVHAERSFEKSLNVLHRQQAGGATLLAVPCILGVNLTDVDLLEFLQQLADTDGSSTIPPSVLRVLNFKACRGAIMFGDTLLPSECSLIVEELKQTSLCFQCAHGRPTTVPLVNLGALRKQIAKLGLWNGGGGSNEPWHGLGRREISLERASLRLSSSGISVDQEP